MILLPAETQSAEIDDEKSPEPDPELARRIDQLCARLWLRPSVRDETVQQLIAIGEPAVKPLIKELRHEMKTAREAAKRALIGIGDPAIGSLRELLYRKRGYGREIAIDVLTDMGTPRALETLRECLLRELAGNARRKQWSQKSEIVKAGIGIGYLVVALLLVTMLANAPPGQKTVYDLVRVSLQALTIGVTLVGFWSVVRSVSRKTIIALADTEDVRMVSVLAGCLLYDSEEARQSAADALGGRDADLILAILRALEQVGDEKALPAVERLVEIEPYHKVGRAAEACLPALRQRVEQARLAQTLLRPASAPNAPSEVLLRPAGPRRRRWSSYCGLRATRP